MIWTRGEHGMMCVVPGMGEFGVEFVEWFSPPWSAYFFMDGHEVPLGKHESEPEAKAECARVSAAWENALLMTRIAGHVYADDGA